MRRNAADVGWIERGIFALRLRRPGWIALLTGAAAAWCLAVLVWARHGADEALALWSAGLDRQGPWIDLASAASGYGKPAMGALLLAALVVSISAPGGRRDRPVFLLTLMSLGISGVAGDLLKELIARPRPCDGYSAVSVAADPSRTWSFPSGHSTKAVALALPFLVFVGGWRGWRGLIKWVLALLALSVCASRVVLGAHFLSDVLGGAAMALSGLPLAVLASNAVLRRMTPADGDGAVRVGIGVYVLMIVLLWVLS
jgi:membrane-associated phospholipid phosphatase